MPAPSPGLPLAARLRLTGWVYRVNGSAVRAPAPSSSPGPRRQKVFGRLGVRLSLKGQVS